MGGLAAVATARLEDDDAAARGVTEGRSARQRARRPTARNRGEAVALAGQDSGEGAAADPSSPSMMN